MGKIILLAKHQDMKQKKRESAENIAALLSYMTSEISKILDKPGIEMVEEREKQNRKRFEKQYENVLLRTPGRPETQIQYFACILSEFLPVIFHSEWKNRFDAYMDFSEFYLSEFDDAYCRYLKENREYEKKYPFRFLQMDTNALEKELYNCLLQIITSSSITSSNKRAEIILWQSCRLFELYHILDDLLMNEKQGENTITGIYSPDTTLNIQSRATLYS